MKTIKLISNCLIWVSIASAHMLPPIKGTIKGYLIDQNDNQVRDTVYFTEQRYYLDDSITYEHHVELSEDTLFDGSFSVEYDSVFELCWGIGGPRIVPLGGCFPKGNFDTSGYVIQLTTTRYPHMDIGPGSISDLRLIYSYSGINQFYLRNRSSIRFTRDQGKLPEEDANGSILHRTAETYLAPATKDPTPENLVTMLALYPSPSKPCQYYPLPLDSVQNAHELDEAPHYEDDGWVDTLYLFDASGKSTVDAFYIYLKWCRKYGKAYIVQPPVVSPEEMKAEMVVDITINEKRNDPRLVTYER